VGKRQISYLQNVKIDDTIQTTRPFNMDSRVYAGTSLYIVFFNPNEEINLLLNGGKILTSTASLTNASIYFSSYTVNDSGYVDLPFIGKVKVEGMTLEQAKFLISEKINQLFQETLVSIRLAERTITVLGEVKNPGTFHFYRDNLTLLYVLGMSGDLTDYANRKNIKIIRQTPSGTIVSYIDVTSADFIKSPYYYLQNNDVVFIEPLVAKTFQTRSFPIGTILSILTSALVIYTYIK